MKDKMYNILKSLAIFGLIYGAIYYLNHNEPKFARYDLGWKITLFASAILFMARKKILSIGVPLMIIFGFFPATSMGVNKILISNNIQIHPVVKWIIVATLVSAVVAIYKFGFKLINEIGYRIFAFTWDVISSSFSSSWKKLFGKKKVDIDINLSIEQIDAFGDPNAKNYAHQKGYAFEDYIASLYRAAGYDAKTTTELRALKQLPPKILANGGSGEQGVDVIVKYPLKGGGTHILLIQCKHYNSDKVSNSAVQQVHTALSVYKGNQACVITNNYFTQPAKDVAKDTNVLLVDRDALQEMIKKVVAKVEKEKKSNKPFFGNFFARKKAKDYEEFRNNPYIQQIDKEEKQTTVEQYNKEKKAETVATVTPITKNKKEHPNDAFWKKMGKGA